MPSQHLTGSQHTSTPHLDTYLNGIRETFDRLNQELSEARKQRDDYKANYRIQAKELRELRHTVFCHKNGTDHIICQYCKGEIAHTCRVEDDYPSSIIPPISSSSEYRSSFEGEDIASDRLDNTANPKKLGRLEEERNQQGHVQERDRSEMGTELTTPRVAPLSLESTVCDVEFNSDSTALNMNLVHKLPQKGGIYLTFSMDGKYLATGSSTGVLSIFDVKTGERISVMRDLYEKEIHPSYECIRFSPDSKYLATGDSDGKVRIWIPSKRTIRNIYIHGRGVNALDFSPNSQCIVTCSDDKTVRIWRLRDGFSRVLAGVQYQALAVRFSPDGRYVASGCNAWRMLISNARTGKLVARWRGHLEAVRSLAFTPDGNGLLSASWDKTVIRWDVASLSSLETTELANSEAYKEGDLTSPGAREISRLVGHTDRVHVVSISPDGKWIASGSGDKTVRVWNAHDGTSQCLSWRNSVH